jgi:hypothetical protein
MKPTFVQLTEIYAGTNHSKMDQNTPIILDKENIPPDAHRNDIARANVTHGSIYQYKSNN